MAERAKIRIRRNTVRVLKEVEGLFPSLHRLKTGMGTVIIASGFNI